uniref:Uncharacterized protein n=1 Tax=Aegilops tauschii subsp. strangulata TaxID=200361 RepID=A0A453HLL3_AEGTS
MFHLSKQGSQDTITLCSWPDPLDTQGCQGPTSLSATVASALSTQSIFCEFHYVQCSCLLSGCST